MVARIVFIASVLFFSNIAIAENTEDDEAAVWALEKSYWKYVGGNDIEAFEKLWDKRIIGWGSGNKDPFQGFPEGARVWIQSLHSDPTRVFKYEITPEYVRAFGDVVITQYRSREYFLTVDTNEVVDELSDKITHTWQRTGSTWQIIGGMSSHLSQNE